MSSHTDSPILLAKQRGVALITVLLVVAILAAVTTTLLARHNLVVNHHQNSFEQRQALEYALGAEEMARQLLFDDFVNAEPGVDHLEETWARQTLPFEIERGYIEAQLRDVNGCFNINSFASNDTGPQLTRLKRLLQQLDVDEAVADKLKDWIDQDTAVTGFGAEDSAYQSAGFVTANQAITDTSELFILDGVEREQIAAIMPHMCVLPSTENKVNVNTASSLALFSLDNGVSLETAQALVDQPRTYPSVAEFVQTHDTFLPLQNQLQVSSDYFLLHAKVQVAESTVTLASLFYRNPENGDIRLLQRDFGKLFRSNLRIESNLEEG